MPNFTRYQYKRLAKSDEYFEELCQFLDSGDPNLKVFKSTLLLHEAAQSYEPNFKVLNKLIDSDAKVDLATKCGSTPLMFAVMSRNQAAVSLLLQANAKVNVQNSLGRTALHYAIDSCYPMDGQALGNNNAHNMVDMLLLKDLLNHDDIDVNPVSSEGETPLMWAVKQKHHGAVRALLRKGANPNLLDQTGRNSLHLAASSDNPSSNIVFELLHYGTDIYNKDQFGQTPMDFILQSNVDDSFRSASQYLVMIVLRYHIKEDLELQVEQIPSLIRLLMCARKEVEWMHEEIIYDKVTLFDFVNGCYQERAVADPTSDIYLPVVKMLLTEKYSLYFNYILQAMSRDSLFDVLDSLFRSFPQFVSPVMNLKPPMQTHLDIFQLIRDCFNRIKQCNLEQIN